MRVKWNYLVSIKYYVKKVRLWEHNMNTYQIKKAELCMPKDYEF